MRTQVCIVGGGPSGLLLGQILHRAGIDTRILERRPRAHVLSRIRAGVLEGGTVDMLRRAGVGDRLAREGFVHTGTRVASRDRAFRIDFAESAGKPVTVYGQTEVTQDLYDARDASDAAPVIHGVEGVTIHGADTDVPHVTYDAGGTAHRIDCDWVVGCDGFHGVSRRTIPEAVRTEVERVYPFGWLGVLSETPPVDHELIYANSPRGFALASMRNENLSRYYVQAPVTDRAEDWPDDRFWDELRRRLPADAAETLVTGPSIEKSLAPLRSFICEPMRWGRLCLVGDAAHIVPPTGAKGLNLAVSDVHYLSEGLIAACGGEAEGMDRYSDRALARVWKAVRYSWWFTTLMHRYPDDTAFHQKMQEAEIAYLDGSPAARTVFAENYVGLPF
ncbi:4-hydroxybenzoate 3-monooxygenase [Jannaschia sp. Os4]|uniref:4-hydroxybenzoate 3-monooxygenase n=1 Tax=Jannaschia sp. Os4 TaxID=2807617 RepID=UPI00193A4C17|nr:4-hydroxybenzoate 3-monooxygenase [Jannaschia sp. Os4]